MNNPLFLSCSKFLKNHLQVVIKRLLSHHGLYISNQQQRNVRHCKNER